MNPDAAARAGEVLHYGEPCRNPGRYWVGDKLSCNRGHAQYR